MLEACWLTAVVAVPLAVNPAGAFPFSVYKAVLLQLVVGVMVVAWVVKMVIALRMDTGNPEYRHSALQSLRRFITAPFMAPVMAFAGVCLLSVPFSISPATSFWGTPSRMEGAMSSLALLAFFLIVAWELRTTGQVRRVVWAVLLGSTTVALIGVIAHWLDWPPFLPGVQFNEPRASATMGNPIMLGAYLVMALSLLTGKLALLWNLRTTLLRNKVFWQTTGLSALLALHLVVLFLTGSRGPWIGLLATLAVFLAIHLMKHRRWRLLRLQASAVALAGLFALAVNLLDLPGQWTDDNPYLSRAVEMVDLGSGTGRQRMLIWEGTKNLIVNRPAAASAGDPWPWVRPLLGYGHDTLQMAFENVYPPELRRLAPETRVDRAHNLVLDLMVRVGLLGLLPFGLVIGAFFLSGGRLLKRTQQIEEQLLLAALTAAVAGYLVSQLVGLSSLSDGLVFWTLLALMAVLARGQLEAQGSKVPLSAGAQEPAPTRLMLRNLPGTVALALVSGAVALGLYVNGGLLFADVQVRKGVDFMKGRDWLSAADTFERASDSPAFRAMSNWYLAQAYSFWATEFRDPTDRATLLALAAERIDTARILDPAETGYHQRAALIYTYWTVTLDPAKYDAAVDAFTEAARISPTSLNIYNQWAELETRNANYQRAQELLRRSLDLDPEWAPTYFQLGVYYEALGQTEEMETAYSRFVELLSSMTHYAALPHAERYVQVRPEDWNGRFALAVIYNGRGLTRAARTEAEAALSLAPPTAQAEIRQFLDSLRFLDSLKE